MSTREALHAEIDRLPESVLEAVSNAFERLREDPFLFMLNNLPIDDEPLSAAGRAALEAGRVSTGPTLTRMSRWTNC